VSQHFVGVGVLVVVLVGNGVTAEVRVGVTLLDNPGVSDLVGVLVGVTVGETDLVGVLVGVTVGVGEIQTYEYL
jgi:hypothetical protein